MRFTIGCLLCILAAAVAGSAADASRFSATNGKLVYSIDGKGPSHLVASNADGSNPVNLTKPSSSPGDFAPRVSADGTKAVFVRGTKTAHDVWIVRIASHRGHEVKVTGLPTKTYAFAPTFTPNGKAIIFELDKGMSTLGIWRVATKGGKATQLVKGHYSGPAVSPDGRAIAFYSDSMADFGKIKTATITGKNVKTVFDRTNAGSGAALASDPHFSPDGTQLAIALSETNTQTGNLRSNIAVIPSTGGDPTYLTSNAADDMNYSPKFSPDGTTVAWIHAVFSGKAVKTEIDSAPATGGSTSVLVPTSPAGLIFGLDWQPKK